MQLSALVKWQTHLVVSQKTSKFKNRRKKENVC